MSFCAICAIFVAKIASMDKIFMDQIIFMLYFHKISQTKFKVL